MSSKHHSLSREIGTLCVTAVLAAVASVLTACGGKASSDPPNILLISLDSTRQDLLSCYGRKPVHAPPLKTTPNIDRLAAEGVRFENAYASTSWTLPSHAALLTGQPDLVHGVEYDSLAISASRPLLAEVLGSNGYRTTGFFSGPYLSPDYGFGRGFERYAACYGNDLALALEEQARCVRDVLSTADPQRATALQAEYSRAVKEAELLSQRDVSSKMVTDAVLGELASARIDDRPWFIFAHYFDPHYDYVPPPPHDGSFDPDYQGSIDGRNFYRNPAVSVPKPLSNRPRNRERTIGKRDLEHIQALYEGEIHWTDTQVGRILDDLRAHGELDTTLVVLLSDHGDEFFEHGNIGHRRTLFEEVLKVPLIMRYPARLPAGKVPVGVASLPDVFATVLELAEIECPSGVMSASLVQLATGREDTTQGRAFGRLVDPRTVSTKDGPGLRIRIQETFIRWPIKIRRMCQWVDPSPAMPEPHRSAMLARADNERARDLMLAWIDLEQTPGEGPGDYSANFDTPESQAALAEFRRLYQRMTDLREQPQSPDQAGAPESVLSALGYAGADSAAVEELMVDRFLLAPPGPR